MVVLGVCVAVELVWPVIFEVDDADDVVDSAVPVLLVGAGVWVGVCVALLPEAGVDEAVVSVDCLFLEGVLIASSMALEPD